MPKTRNPAFQMVTVLVARLERDRLPRMEKSRDAVFPRRILLEMMPRKRVPIEVNPRLLLHAVWPSPPILFLTNALLVLAKAPILLTMRSEILKNPNLFLPDQRLP
jgi:hypothetical protein